MEDTQSCKLDNKAHPWCLGRIPYLFETNVGASQQCNGSPVSRSRSDISNMNPHVNHMEDKLMVSECKRTIPEHKANGTPMKRLIAQEMTKEVNSGNSSPNLIARLMGLDSLPHQQHGSANQRNLMGHHRCHSEISICSWEQQNATLDYLDHHQGTDVREVWSKSTKPNHKDRHGEPTKHRQAAFIRQKLIDGSRMSSEEKLRQSKQFQDALEVLNSNKELFVKCLEEPKAKLSQYNLQLIPPPLETRHVTVLRPSKYAEKNSTKVGGAHGKQVSKDGFVQVKCFEKRGSAPSDWKNYEDPPQPTRIVVLKPGSGKACGDSCPESECSTMHDDYLSRSAGDIDSLKSKAFANAVAEQIDQELGRHHRDEISTASAFSNGYVADDSSFNKSDTEFPAGNLSDAEITSLASRHGSPSSSSYNRLSHSPQPSVYIEAKKRLSERWSKMECNEIFREQKLVQKSSSTLGEMLALSETKKTPSSAESMDLKSLFMSESKLDEHLGCSSFDLATSKSTPVHSASCITKLTTDTHGSDGEIPTSTDESRTLGGGISSFRGKVSSLFFSRNRTSNKDEARSCVGHERDNAGTATFLGADPSPNTKSFEIDISNRRSTAPASPAKNQHSQSLVSTSDTVLEKNEQATRIPGYLRLERRGSDLPPSTISSTLIDKSPPLGSISSTVSYNDSRTDKASTCPIRRSISSSGKEEPKEEWSLYLNTLLSAAGLQGKFQSSLVFSEWHSPESPLDPSLREKYMNLNEKRTLHEAKRRQKRSMQKLVFDCVNEALLETSGYIHGNTTSCTDPMKRVVDPEHSKDAVIWWNSLFDYETGCSWDGFRGDIFSMVEKEVVGKAWSDNLSLEMDLIGMKIGGKVMEDLVEETLLELAGK